MIFESKVYGKIEYSKENIFDFSRPLLGFENLKKFILVDLKEYEPFKLLHSLDDQEVGFIVISPFDFFKEYEFKLGEEVIKRLKITSQKEVIILSTVTLNSNVDKITTNLKAPIVINIMNGLGEQIILDKTKYKIKQPLMKER